MNRKLLKHLEAQFGSNWSCACRTPFDPGRFEILEEKPDSFLAHYICPVCGREQMLAATTGNEEAVTTVRAEKNGGLSSDDVLDIRSEIRRAPLRKLKTLLKGGQKAQLTAATDVDTLLRFSKDE